MDAYTDAVQFFLYELKMTTLIHYLTKGSHKQEEQIF